jgi:hypothetical protein
VKELNGPGGARRLGVPVPPPARGPALARILALKGNPGWLVGSDTVERWRFEGVAGHGEATYLAGPAASGVTLETAMAGPPAEALPKVARLADALATLCRKDVPLFPLEADAVLFCRDGSVLFLPPAVMRELRGHRSFAETRDTWEALNHPDLSGTALASWSIAVILFRVAAGRFPFAGASAEEMRQRIREHVVSPAEGPVPAPVMEALARPESVSLADWGRHISAWRTAAPGSPGPRAARPTSERTFRVRRFWQRNGVRVAVIAGACLLAAGGAAWIVGTLAKPRLTHGFSPAKVVETFYESTDTLDHEAMRACVTGGAGGEELDQVTTIYVTSRVTQGYEGRSGVVSASAWDRQGRPALPAGTVLYGATGLSVTEEQGPPAPVLRAEYEMWIPVTAEGPPSAAPACEGHRRVDRLWLKRDRGDWVIHRIERLRDDLLTTPVR